MDSLRGSEMVRPTVRYSVASFAKVTEMRRVKVRATQMGRVREKVREKPKARAKDFLRVR